MSVLAYPGFRAPARRLALRRPTTLQLAYGLATDLECWPRVFGTADAGDLAAFGRRAELIAERLAEGRR